MPAGPALASVVIPNWNGRQWIGDCLASLSAQRYRPLELIVADGGSHDGSQELVARQFPHARLVRLPVNRGFAGNVNAGIRAARGEWIVLFNNDARAEPDLVAELVAALEVEPQAGAATAKVLYQERPNVVASAGDCLHRNGLASQRGNGASADCGWLQRPAFVFGASGSACALRRSMLRDVGLFDERFFAYLEDVDLAMRAHWRGWSCLYVPSARASHRGSATGGGPLASYYVARNTLWLLAKGFPTLGLRRFGGQIVWAQLGRAAAAARAWRGAAARATLRGLAVGWASLPLLLPARQRLMAARRISDEALLELLS